MGMLEDQLDEGMRATREVMAAEEIPYEQAYARVAGEIANRRELEAPDAPAASMEAPGYDSLAAILSDAYSQSAYGKGRVRHANGRAFDDQPILRMTELTGIGGPSFQAIKKIQEAIGMVANGRSEAAVEELLGAIVYTAAVVRFIQLHHI